MRRPILILLISMLTVTSLAANAEEWKKEFTTSGKATLRVETNDADIRISSWDGKVIEARVITEGYKIGPNDVRIAERQSGDMVEMDVHRPRGRICFGVCNQSISIEVRVPHEADLALHTGDGNIRVEEVKGDLRLDSGDGDLYIRSADGRIGAATHDGRIRAQGRFDGLDLHTGDGNIDADVDAGSKISSAWALRTGDGNISLRLPPEFSADLDAQTGDGHVSVDFPVTVQGSVRENSVRGKMNGGGALIEVRTGDGNIDLGKS